MAIFSILSKHADRVIEEPPASSRKRQPWPELGSMVNALIRRALLYIQQCKDPSKDPELSFADFQKAVELDPDNADIYHHRGQVHLLIDATNKAIVDFTKASSLQPNFAVAYIQKLYTDYRAASTIGNNNCKYSANFKLPFL